MDNSVIDSIFMYNSNIEFQIILFLMYGILFGGICKNILIPFIFIVIYEFYIFHITRFFPPKVRELDRFLINIVYIFGWILGRILMLNETGFEDLFNFF